MKKRGFVLIRFNSFIHANHRYLYVCGIHPETGEEVYVPKSKKEMAMQRALLQFYKPGNHALVKEALRLTKNEELIGFLLSPRSERPAVQTKKKERGKRNDIKKAGKGKTVHRKTTSLH